MEGIPCVQGMGSKSYPTLENIARNGVRGIEIQKVNGAPLNPAVTLRLGGKTDFSPAARYVLRGFQADAFGPGELDPEELIGDLPQVTSYNLHVTFFSTRVVSTGTK